LNILSNEAPFIEKKILHTFPPEYIFKNQVRPGSDNAEKKKRCMFMHCMQLALQEQYSVVKSSSICGRSSFCLEI
jgi:hypothetical protein